MRNKSTLVMIEHIVMLLVFALAATVCVRMFVLSENLSKKYEATDRAVLTAQNVAEVMKKYGAAGLSERTGVMRTGENTWVVFYDEDWEVTDEERMNFVLKVEVSEESGFLWRADVVVSTDAGEELFRLPVAGQIVAEVTAYEKV